jgi:hypothetical protein
MEVNMKRILFLGSALIGMVVLMSCSFISFAGEGKFTLFAQPAYDPVAACVDFNENKRYCNAEADSDFADDVVLVGLTKKETFSFRKYTIIDFPEIKLTDLKEIITPTYIIASAPHYMVIFILPIPEIL